MTNDPTSETADPACKFDEGCHRVTACDPGCAVSAAELRRRMAAPSRRAGLRDEIVNALGQIDTIPPIAHRRAQADQVLALLYREWPWLRAEAEDADPPLSPDYKHLACGFHWHGRDDMDVPMRDGQPVCPRCELAKLPAPADRAAVRDALRRADEAEQRAAAMGRAMESTAADAAAHRFCHMRLMAQCQRAEQAEARVAELADDLQYVLGYRGPGHAHEKPGMWDTSGKPCEHCARLALAQKNLDAATKLRRMAAEARDSEQQDDGPTWSDTCPHCKRWYTTSEPGAHEAACPMRTGAEAQQDGAAS